jgi:spermidine/putrescine-binding protein
VGRRGFVAGAAGAAAALAARRAQAQPEVEVVDITDGLIAEARREGQVTIRYSSPVDEMQQMARAFEQRFGIRV